MKFFFRTIFAVALLLMPALALQGDDMREKYIRQWRDVAMEQMAASGVPASITLAQGCLESANGTSRLAVEANNHFGIKCRNWSGPVVHHDDDIKNDCFRRYESAEQSFSDHSDFLRYNDRYSFLFDLEPGDYRGWARGLKKAGYATDPSYAEKLIKIIEDYKLYQYDLAGDSDSDEKGELVAEPALPPSPSTLERPREVERPLNFRPNSLGKVYIDYKFYEKHGVLYIIATGTETYASLAREFNLFKRELLRYNEEKKDHTIPAGTVVYLEPKRTQSSKDLAKHVVEEGETMKSMSQRFAVKMKYLYKYNNMRSGREPEPGTIINLRKVK
ncbi:MAG: glucosaminidase domain-containing protein [Bacteroidales bacterium]|nr:glucosaminidase domain-containing protein [Bacteroidales bacterium]